MTATGFSSYIGSVKDIPIVNLLDTFDTLDVTTIILYHNNTIYIRDIM